MKSTGAISTVFLIQSDENDSCLDGLIHETTDKRNEIIEISPKGRFFKVIYIQFNEIISKSSFKIIYRAFDNELGCEVS